ncbi:hypothetical protein KEM54_002679 [Ascosphaera aggregata]|nr:hypothetical protein KEM54_002679 [Ascosphaera aggregata]
MSLLTASSLRSVLCTAKIRPVYILAAAPKTTSFQKRYAQVHDVRFFVSHHDPSSQIVERYKLKLDRKAKALLIKSRGTSREGHDSIDSLKDAYKDKINDLRKKALSPEELLEEAKAYLAAAEAEIVQPVRSCNAGQIPSQSQSASQSTTTSTAQVDPRSSQVNNASQSSTPGVRPLSSYLDLDKIKALPPKEIEAIWRLRHASKPNSICAVIPIDTYLRMAGTAKLNPQFVLPLPRKLVGGDAEGRGGKVVNTEEQTTGDSVGATEIHFLQWAFLPPAGKSPEELATSTKRTINNHTSTVLFTHLAQYKLQGPYAEPHTVLTHHLDLADEKGLVLMNGTILPDKGVSIADAQLLSLWVQKFYDWGVNASMGGKKADLLRCFTSGDTKGFKIEELMDEVERL